MVFFFRSSTCKNHKQQWIFDNNFQHLYSLRTIKSSARGNWFNNLISPLFPNIHRAFELFIHLWRRRKTHFKWACVVKFCFCRDFYPWGKNCCYIYDVFYAFYQLNMFYFILFRYAENYDYLFRKCFHPYEQFSNLFGNQERWRKKALFYFMFCK